MRRLVYIIKNLIMAKKTLIEKAVELFEAYPVQDQKEAFIAVKELVTKSVIKEQAALQDKADAAQNFLQKVQSI